MTTAADTADPRRHRVLEGVLLRLARRPGAAERFVLRGGMLMRHWFAPVPRPADDIDLVATFPFSVEAAAAHFVPVLSESVEDGVWFDPDRTRAAGIRLESEDPAVRVFATGVIGDEECDFTVDLTFGPYLRPNTIRERIMTLCGLTAGLHACRPEAVAGQKMQALRQRGATGWRPKDLNDLRLLFRHTRMDDRVLRDAIGAYLADLGATLEEGRAIFVEGAWWDMKLSTARWSDFVRDSPGQSLPHELSVVVAEVAERVRPVLEGSP